MRWFALYRWPNRAPKLANSDEYPAVNTLSDLPALTPGDAFGERVNQLDFRVGKILRFGRQRATISADLLNALNTDAILTYNQGYSPTTTCRSRRRC